MTDFLRRELAPYPGRTSTVIRMTIAASLVMLAIMTFRIPGGALGGYFALLISRENLRSTMQQTFTTLLAFAAGTVYTLLGVIFFVDSPVTHFFWVIGSLYLIFFVMSTVRNYGAAAGFSFLIATAIPLWDRAGPVELKIYATLWTLGSVALGLCATLLVETIYRGFHPKDPVVTGLVDRLRCVELELRTRAHGEHLDGDTRAKLLQYAMIGPASLRRAIVRNGQTPQVRAQVAALISLTGRLVDLSVSFEQTSERLTLLPEESARLLALANAIGAEASDTYRLHTVEQALQLRTPAWRGPETPTPNLPLLAVLEETVTMLRAIFSPVTAETRATALLKLEEAQPSSSIFFSDAFTDHEHLVFALRGCFAASLCYLVYNLIDWPGINTAVATCIITALGTIGSSRQKQILRMGGAIAGGFLIALPAQIYLLPLMDSITAFTLYFAAVTALAAWFATSSPRLSYFGLQIALAFYLINLQEFTIQISLSVARDRVFGVLLGLVAMWVVFDQLWAPTASAQMQTILAQILDALSQVAAAVAEFDEGTPEQDRAALLEVRRLRETINNNFTQMNNQADAIEFEVGTGREVKLQARERMQAMQPAMRTVFLLEVALGQYRSSAPSPSRACRDARRRFQNAVTGLLAAMARQAENPQRSGVAAGLVQQVQAALAALEEQEQRDAGLALCRQIAEALSSLWLAQGGQATPERESQLLAAQAGAL
jgi:multidrug resistance protein MdtO